MERIGQPAMIGEVLAGMIMGPSILNFVSPSPELKVIADLGVFLLIVVAGLEIRLDDLRNSIRGRSKWIAILGFIVPCAFGLVVGYLFKLDFLITIFVSLCIAITALPVSVRILMDLGKLNTDIGQKIISAAIINDIVSLLVLGFILDINKNFESPSEMFQSIGLTFIKIILLIVIIYIIYKAFNKVRKDIDFFKHQIDLLMKFLRGKESLYALVMLFVLVFATLTELAGLHFIIGAFFAALLINKDVLGFRNFVKVRNTTNSITMGFLAPVFFASAGVLFSWESIDNYFLLITILVVSLISKLAGGYFGGRMAGMQHQEAFTLGIGLNARGIMELVIASIALRNGFIDQSLFSILVIMGLLTTIISPYLLKKSFMKIKN